MKHCYLEISSFTDIGSIRAEHYYGKLHMTREHKIDLTRSINAKEALYLNKKDGWDGWKKGDHTSRFNNKQDLIKLAKKTYKQHFPKAKTLILGYSYLLDPHIVIDGPTNFVKEGNKLYNEAEKIGWYEGNEEKMEKISDKWQKLLGKQ